MPQEVAEMVARRLRNSFSASTLTRLRQMPACDALALLATYLKPDPTYRPIKDDQQPRWHLSTGRGDFEIVTTGPSGTTHARSMAGVAPSTWRCTSWTCAVRGRRQAS
jgi:hypothetical protein